MLRLPQSTVSRHLKTLADGGWVTSRREATSRLYSVDAAALPDSAKGLWQVVRGQVGSAPGCRGGRAAPGPRPRGATRHLAGVLRRRGRRVGPPARRAVRRVHAGQGAARPARSRLDRRRPRLRRRARRVAGRPLRPPRDRRRRVGGDARRGRGARARPRRPAPGHARSAAASATARSTSRCSSWCCTTCRDPARALAEAARILKPGGRLVVVDMQPHDREDYRQQHGPRLARLRRAADHPPAARARASRRRASCRWPPKHRPKGRRCSWRPHASPYPLTHEPQGDR